MKLRFLALFLVVFMVFSPFSLFSKPFTSIKVPEWSFNKTIYEVNLRQYTPSGTIKEFSEHLPRLKDMGVGILWFMPIHPIGVENRKGTLGSYYAVKDYKDIDPAYGTKEEFRELVKEIHAMGMYIIIDWVANHTAWDNLLTKTNPEFYTRNKEGNFVPPVEDWSDVIDLNYSNKELWSYMSGALDYWVKEFDIDGYRCDVASMVPKEFWDYAYTNLLKIKSVFMLAEADDVKLHQKSFHMSYSWDIFHTFKKIASGEEKPQDFLKKLKKYDSPYPPQAFRMRFTTNHDENSWNGTEFELFKEGTLAFSTLAATIPGMMLVYSGQEAGNTKRLSFFEKDPINWSDLSRTDFYKKLNRLKLKNRALHNGAKAGSMESLKHSNGNIVSFLRRNGSDIVFVVINLTAGTQSSEFKPVKGLPELKDIFSENKQSLASKFTLTLKPWEYRVYSFTKE